MTNSFSPGAPVWVYRLDEENHINLATPELLRGVPGDAWHVDITEISGYRYLKTEGTKEGVFSEKSHIVRIWYRRDDWGEVQSINMFLHFNGDTQVYSDPNKNPTNIIYPAGVTLQAFERVATKNGQFWYSIGPNQWVQYNNNLKIVEPPTSSTGLNPTEFEITKMDSQSAHISYISNMAVSLYDYPYGNITSELKNNSPVTVIGSFDDASGLNWYQLADNKFVNAKYIKFD